jgi:hypothetical protein
MTKTLTKEGLRQFTGSETAAWPCPRFFTDGAKHVADAGGAYWLLDEIALAQRYNKAVAGEDFQVWKLAVDLDKSAGTLTCEDGNMSRDKPHYASSRSHHLQPP